MISYIIPFGQIIFQKLFGQATSESKVREKPAPLFFYIRVHLGECLTYQVLVFNQHPAMFVENLHQNLPMISGGRVIKQALPLCSQLHVVGLCLC